MPRLRILASLALAASLTAVPALAHAQAEDTSTLTTPLALAPDGTLPLQGTPWRLQGYRWRGVDRQPGPEVAARMTLSGDELKASGGCTAFKGRYGVVGSAIRFDLRGLKENDCAEQTMLVQLGMIDGLRKATSLAMVPAKMSSDTELVLYGATGTELLRFGLDEIGALDAGEWQLAAYSIGGERVEADPGQPAVLDFRSKRDKTARRQMSGPVTGSSGCNGLVAEFYRHADVISFSDFERTEAPCSPALAAQEAAMLSVLDATSLRVDLSPDTLVLTAHESGDSLLLVASQTLEGSTWLATRIRGAGTLAGEVTLRLDGGRATGEGPCGPYAADYASDGLFITFSDAVGANDEACLGADDEKVLLSALRDTVVLDRDQPQLILRDARGNLTAKFKPPSGP